MENTSEEDGEDKFNPSKFKENQLAKQFDRVKSVDAEKQSASEKNEFATAKKIVKVFTMLLVFIALLGTTVLSKVSLCSRLQ